jgi:hypothetical protein
MVGRRIPPTARAILVLLTGLAWIATCAAPCVGQAATPGPWRAPDTPVAQMARTSRAACEANTADGWSCDEDEECVFLNACDGGMDDSTVADECDFDGFFDGEDWDGGGGDLGGASEPMHMDHLTANESFTPAVTFLGPKLGMAFKKGPHGLGYYVDRVPAQSNDGPRTISLHDLIPLEAQRHGEAAPSDQGTTEAAAAQEEQRQQQQQRRPQQWAHLDADRAEEVRDMQAAPSMRHSTAAPSSRRGPRTRRRRAAFTYEVPDDADAADNAWKRAGLWAIDSVNPNSWDGAMSYLERTAADAALIQETRKIGGQVTTAERSAARSGWTASVAEAEKTECGGVTAGLAVAVRKHIGLARINGGDAGADADSSSRVHVRWMGGTIRGGLHLITAWPHHSEGRSLRGSWLPSTAPG